MPRSSERVARHAHPAFHQHAAAAAHHRLGHDPVAIDLLRFCAEKDVRPIIEETLPLACARRGFAAMLAGSAFGKIVFTV